MADITAELSELLALQNRHYEAINVLTGYEELTGHDVYFDARKISLQATLDSLPDSNQKKSFRVPKLYNEHFYISSRISKDKKHKTKAFMVDTGASMLVMDKSWLEKNNVKYRVLKSSVRVIIANGKKIKAKLVKIPYFELGPFALRNVKVLVCKKCQPLIGQNILKHFDMSTERVNGVEFLLLKKRG